MLTNPDIALQLTLKAMELKVISFTESTANTEAEKEERNAFNAKQISDFLNKIESELST